MSLEQSIIKVDTIQQSIDGQTYLILERHQEWREKIHRLTLTPVAIEHNTKRLIGPADSVLLIDVGHAGEFPINLHPALDYGYIPLGLLNTDYLLSVNSHSNSTTPFAQGVTPLSQQPDNRLSSNASVNPDQQKDKQQCQAVFKWLGRQSEWIQDEAQVIYA